MKLRKIPQTRGEARKNLLNLVLIALVLDFAIATDNLGIWASFACMAWAWWIPIRRYEKITPRDARD